MLIRRFFAFVISAFLIFFPSYSYAASSWYPQSVVVTGSTAIINAAKQGYRSTISHAPAAAAVGKELVKVGGAVAFAYAASQLLDAGIEWVMTEGGDIKYQVPTAGIWVGANGAATGATAQIACASQADGRFTYHSTVMLSSATAGCFYTDIYGDGSPFQSFAVSQQSSGTKDVIISRSTVAAKVISNAASGHVPSQDVVRAAATADVFSGSLDGKLTDNAVPSDAPFDPTRPNDPEATPFDPSSIIAALQSVMSAINNMSSSIKAKIETLLTEMGVMHQENIAEQKATQQVINDGMADVVAANNATGARVGDVVAAIEALEGNTLDGQVINDAVDRVIAEGKTNTSDIVAAIEAIEGNTLDGQVINDAVDRVIANDNANAQAAADAATAAADAATAADAANTASVTDAIDAQTDAISETNPVTGVKSLKLPAFCSWALPVCDFLGWVAEPVPDDEEKKDVPFATTGDIGLDDVDRFEKRIEFSGQCPVNDFSFSMMGVTYAKPIPYHHLCGFLEQIAPWLLAMCYLGTAYFVVENI